MKYITTICFFILLLSCVVSSAEDLTQQQQRDIILNYMYATGQISRSAALSEGLTPPDESYGQLPICGTPAVLEFELNKDKFDPGLMMALGVQTATRPTGLDDSLVSPSGHFLIHYTTTGTNAVYSKIPGYVDSVARIYDEVYNHMVNVLGYPAPPSDGFYPGSGDSKFDVYLLNLPSVYYGLTFVDSARIDGPGTTRATAFQELDNDYQSIQPYKDRPLDAVRVTCAHEFFHVIQFGMDFTETEEGAVPGVNGPAWQEMSAVWSEEENYTYINDYYYYLPYFFNAPWESIQAFPDLSSLHPYASALFPIFLAQRYGKDVIRDIWIKCGQVPGPNFLLATDAVIDSVTGGVGSIASAFREFAIWNYFTGQRATVAPAGVGYTERANYPMFSDKADSSAVMSIWNTYPVRVGGDNPNPPFVRNPFSPDHNAAFYVRFQQLPNIIYDTTYYVYDTTYWNCNNGAAPNCLDSTEVVDTTLGYDFLHVDTVSSVNIDSLFTIIVTLDPGFTQQWGLSIIYQLDDYPDSMIVDRAYLPPGQNLGIGILNPRQYRTATLIFTPASSNLAFYHPLVTNGNYYVAYGVFESTVVDTAQINLPAAVFNPYPNPVVVSQLPDPKVTFKFQVPTDANGLPLYGLSYSGSNPYLVIDIYTLAGEHICTLDKTTASDPQLGAYSGEWNLKNAAGKNVASGVYIADARLYSTQFKGTLLAEKKTKVALIR